MVHVTLNTINDVVGHKEEEEEGIQPFTTWATTKWLICGQEGQASISNLLLDILSQNGYVTLRCIF